MKIDLDISRCCACGACAIACMDQNDIDVEHGLRPFRSVFRDDWSISPDKLPAYFSIACMHCPDAPCVLACPAGCIKKDEATRLTLYDNTHCIGCHSCAMACPFGAPSFGPDGRMQKCDGCAERLRAGLEPACVRACAFGALMVVRGPSEELPADRSLSALCEELAKLQR